MSGCNIHSIDIGRISERISERTSEANIGGEHRANTVRPYNMYTILAIYTNKYKFFEFFVFLKICFYGTNGLKWSKLN